MYCSRSLLTRTLNFRPELFLAKSSVSYRIKFGYRGVWSGHNKVASSRENFTKKINGSRGGMLMLLKKIKVSHGFTTTGSK